MIMKMNDKQRALTQGPADLKELHGRIAELKKLELEHRQKEEKTKHLNAVLHALRSVNKLIIKATGLASIFQRYISYKEAMVTNLRYFSQKMTIVTKSK